MAIDLHFSEALLLCLSLLKSAQKCPQVPCTVFPPRGKAGSVSQMDIKSVEGLLFSQCLGSSLLSAKRRRTEQRNREKGMLDYAKDHLVSGNVTELDS